MRVKQQITHFNLIGSPFKSGFLSKHCGPNVKVQKKKKKKNQYAFRLFLRKATFFTMGKGKEIKSSSV